MNTMNVMKRVTLESVKKNKKRTVATIIAVILSTALICGTAGLCTSALKSFQESAKYQVGDFHVTVHGVPRDDVKQLTENNQVKDSFFTLDLGYAKLEGSKNEEKPYLFVYALGSRALSGGWGVHLIEGRMPENDAELVITDHIRVNGLVNIKPGDTLTLALGKRVNADGDELVQYNTYDPDAGETITDAETKTYTVVGVAERPDWLMEYYAAPGYSCYTYASDAALSGAQTVNVSFTLKDARKYGEFSETMLENLSSCGEVIENTELLEYSGALSLHSLNFLYRIGGIVAAIIMVTSVFVIRNSFAISVSEKTKQYGLLASVGATARQIRRSVLFEGLLYGAIGIPLGIGSGILAIVILLKIVNKLLGDLLNGLTFVYSLPPVFALISAALAAVTIFFSALLPAIRAGRIPPIEAVRGNREVNIRTKELRVSRLTQKLFGVGGVIAAKNLKRSRKKYRTTVISLVVSVSVFIMLFSFVNYGKKSVANQFEANEYNLSIRFSQEKDDEADVYGKLIAAVAHEDCAYYRLFSTASCSLEKYGSPAAKRDAANDLEQALKDYDFNSEYALTEQELRESYQKVYLFAAAYNDAYFRNYAKKLGVENPPADGVILCDLNGKLNLKTGDRLDFEIQKVAEGDEKPEPVPFSASVCAIASEGHPMGLESASANIVVVLFSEKFLPPEKEDDPTAYLSLLYMKVADPNAAESQLQEMKTDPLFAGMNVYNVEADADSFRRIILIAEIFLYGFITVITLIGVTNIFNTITTNMNLRAREFAMLKSIGMTKKEFRRMIRLESIMYGLKSLLIGIPLGIAGSIAFYYLFHEEFELGYVFPGGALIISILFVFIIVGLTMYYSMSKINKQNIIETIRNENT